MKYFKRHSGANGSRNFGLSVYVILILMLNVILISFSSIVSADGGIIPWYKFDAYEPGQKAICAWNGEEEIMILSVDVYASENNKVLHMVPFPSLPEVSLGNMTPFEEVNKIIHTKNHYSGSGSGGSDGSGNGNGYGNVSIKFYERIGAHDITAVKIGSENGIKEWITEFLNDKGVEDVKLPNGTTEVIKHYLGQNIDYFVFDVIEVGTEEKSVDPIIYKFKTDYLFFPMKISSIIPGDSEITLVLITPEDIVLDSRCMENIGYFRSINFKVTKESIKKISSEIGNLIWTDGYITYYDALLSLGDLSCDVKMEKLENINWYFDLEENIWHKMNNDCDGDGVEDIVVSTRTKIFAVSSINGNQLWKFESPEINGYLDNFQLMDLDSDGINDIICQSFDWTGYYYLFAIDGSKGSLTWSWEIKIKNYNDPIIKTADLDSDGVNELILVAKGNTLYALDILSGMDLWSYSISASTYYNQIYDFEPINTNDGSTKDIIIFAQYSIKSLSKNLTSEWKFDTNEPFIALNYNVNINEHNYLEDFDGDKKLEILAATESKMYLLDAETGSPDWEYDFGADSQTTYVWPGFKVVDLDNNGDLEIFYHRYDELYGISANSGKMFWCNTSLKSTHDMRYPILDMHDFDNDGIKELIYTYGQLSYVFKPFENRLYLDHDIEDRDYYYSFDSIKFGDLDSDGTGDLLYTFGGNLEAVSGETGEIIWKNEFENYYFGRDLIGLGGSSCSNFGDFDYDGKYEILGYWGNDIELVNCEDGSVQWNYKYGSNRNIISKSFVDIDNNGLKEFIFYNVNKIDILNPVTGITIWDFNAGTMFSHYTLIDNYSSENNCLFGFSETRVFSLDYRQIMLDIRVNPAQVEVAEAVPFIVFTSNFGQPITDVTLEVNDNGANGTFSQVFEAYSGVKMFTYTVPNTTSESIKITVSAKRAGFLNSEASVFLDVKNDFSEPEKQKKQLKVTPMATANDIKPGNSTIILFYVTEGDNYITENLNFSIFDGKIYGNITPVVKHGEHHFIFSYTVPETDSECIDILIVASHPDYLDGLGIVRLNIVYETTDTQNDDEPEDVIEQPEEEGPATPGKLSLDLTPLPAELAPGQRTTIMVYVNNEYDPVPSAKLLTFDSGIGGKFTDVVDFNNGHYAFTYTAPATIPSSVHSIFLVIYASHNTYDGTYAAIELPIIDETEQLQEFPAGDKISLNIDVFPTQIYSDESTRIILQLTIDSTEIRYTDVYVYLDDGYAGGIFKVVNSDNQGLFIYEYRPANGEEKVIRITAHAYTRQDGKEIDQVAFDLNVVPAKSREQGTIIYSDNSSGIDENVLYISVMLLILIICIIIGLLNYLVFTNKVQINIQSRKAIQEKEIEYNRKIKKPGNKNKN